MSDFADCDSCVTTLLNDLAAKSEELRLVKSQLQGLHVGVGALEQMRHLETQTKELRVNVLWNPEWGTGGREGEMLREWVGQGERLLPLMTHSLQMQTQCLLAKSTHTHEFKKLAPPRITCQITWQAQRVTEGGRSCSSQREPVNICSTDKQQ